MRPDVLSGPRTGPDWPQPAPRFHGVCLLCNSKTRDGRKVVPRRGIRPTFCCYVCVPMGAGQGKR